MRLLDSAQPAVRWKGCAVAVRAVLALALLGASTHLDAQEPSVRITGQVIARDSTPIAGAEIRVLNTRWISASTADGRFALVLPSGNWHLLATRIGYQPDTVFLELQPGSGRASVVIRLRRAPLALAGISVEAAQAPPMSTSVTTETARGVPPLGEPDLFRSIALLPSVSQPNDLKGRIHLAGGASDETGISLDGHPLQDPLHLLGLLGAFNVAALERAEVMMHHLPVEEAGRLSGLISLQTRLPSSQASHEVVTSLLSTSFTMNDGRIPAGLDVLASARATYLDKIVLLVAPDARIAGDDVPLLSYQDALLRIGRQFARGWRVEGLGFATRDQIGVTDRLRASGHRPLVWGEVMGGLRILQSGTRWNASARASIDQGFVDLDASPEWPSFVRMSRRSRSASAKLRRAAKSWRLGAGGSIDEKTQAQAWRTSALTQQIFSPSTPSDFDDEESQVELGIFAEGAVDLTRFVSVTFGTRGTKAGGQWHLGPRALTSFQAGASRVEVSAERRHQYFTELEEPIEGNITPPTFFLAEPRLLDLVAVRIELPVVTALSATTSLTAEGFQKQYRRRPLLRTATNAESFPSFDRVDGSSSGVSLSGRLSWSDDALVQGSYTFQRSRERIQNAWFPTSWDAPHDVTLFANLPAGSRWSVNAVYRGHSGRAVTPIVARLFAPSPELETSLQAKYLRGDRNSVRVAAYHRVDVGARRTWPVRGAQWTLFAQVLNLTNRQNPIDYTWDLFEAVGTDASRPITSRAGIPVLPTIGVEVRW